jgi:hypothetical protein
MSGVGRMCHCYIHVCDFVIFVMFVMFEDVGCMVAWLPGCLL